MDDEKVLRALGRDLARDDPRLASLLSEAPTHHFSPLWLLLVAAVVGVLLLLPITVAVGLVTFVLIAASPLAVCWTWTTVDDGTPPQP
jgi:membrane protein implicated in regulation of membrane protease activity